MARSAGLASRRVFEMRSSSDSATDLLMDVDEESAKDGNDGALMMA